MAAESALLRAAGHQVRMVEGHNASTPARAAAQLAACAWNPVAKRAVRHAIGEFEPDVVHVHNTWFALSPAVVREAGNADARVVMTLHNYRLICSNALLFRDGRVCDDCVGSHPWHGVRHRCYRGSLGGSLASAVNIGVHRWLKTWERAVDRFLVLSQFARSKFIAAGLPAEKLTVKPNFVEDGPGRAGPPSSSRRILFVGRLAEEKGILPLLRAWERARLAGLELVVIGAGPLEQAVRRAKPPGVTIVGRLDPAEVREEMARARALVLPSISYEGQPMVLLEALSAGLPVLASDSGALPEVTRELGEDFSVPPGDVLAWSRALRVVRDQDRVDQAGSIARSIYEKRFSPRIGLPQLQRAYSAS